MTQVNNETLPQGSWWTERRITLAGLGLGIAIVASLGVLSYRALLEQERHIESVNHTHEVLRTIQSVLTLLKDAETGQRGYLLTRDERYLEPYHAASPEIVKSIERLRLLTVDNAEQQPRIEELRSLMLAKLTELRETTELAARAPDAALQRVRTDEGRRIMERTRSVARAMEESEEDLLRVRQSERQQFSTTRLQPAVLVGSLLALGLLIISLGLVARDSRVREQAALLQAQARLLDLAPVTIRDLGGRITMWSHGLTQLYGWTKDEAAGRIGQDLLKSRFPRPLAEIEADLLVKGEWDGEVVHTRRDGTEVMVASHWSLSRDVRQTSVGVVEVHTDITARKRAEDLLQQANQQLIDRSEALVAANKELEAFSYSVSHDLRAPLRAVDGFSRILIEDYGATLEPEIQRYLAIVRKGAVQMGRLIDDLLEFSRLGRHSLQKSPIPLRNVVQDALADLHAEQDGRAIELTIGDLPTCEGDRRLLKQVFVNLLSNALKYTRPRNVAKIEVGCRKGGEQPGPPILYVRDNGVGFDMQYAPMLFGVFQRLHRAEDFEGTGVGLAIVQRIVHRHGGRVWADGEIDRGATFYFTLEGDVS